MTNVEAEAGGRTVRVTNPEKLFFPDLDATKLDLVRYYLDVGPGALTGARDRPTILHRFTDGAAGEGFYQKRVALRTRCVPSWRNTASRAGQRGRALDPRDLTIRTVPARFAEIGDPHDGIGDAPWPPHFPKASGEPVRAQPSRRLRR